MTHSDETLVSLLRSGWRGATATDLMREAADRIEQLHSGVDEFDAVSEPDLPGFEGTRASLDALTPRPQPTRIEP